MVPKAGDREGQVDSLHKTGLARAESEVLGHPSGRVHEEQTLHEAQQRGTGSSACCEGLGQSVCTEQGARPRTDLAHTCVQGAARGGGRESREGK